MTITLTERAAEQVRRSLAKRGKGIGLRLGVRTSGCSGLAYKLEYLDEPGPHDQRFSSGGVDVFVSSDALPYIAGITLDYVREGLNEGFRFHNPNAKDQCGCGESFRV